MKIKKLNLQTAFQLGLISLEEYLKRLEALRKSK